MVLKLWVKTYTKEICYLLSIVPSAIGLLLNYPLMFSLTLNMYMFQCEGYVLEVLHQLEIKPIYSI